MEPDIDLHIRGGILLSMVPGEPWSERDLLVPEHMEEHRWVSG